MSKFQEPPTCLYLTLYPQAPLTASQPKVAEVKPIPVVVAFNGVVQGAKVVKFWVVVQADTELLSKEHAERTCHSYVVEDDKPVFILLVLIKFVMNVVHVEVPCVLMRKS